MHKWTLIVMPHSTARPRRIQVPRAWVRRGAWAAALGAVAIAAIGVDWVRLRMDAVDVDELRAQAARQERELQTLESTVAVLEESLGELRGFERKVRVIADLPGAMRKAEVPDMSPAGQGGPGKLPEPEGAEQAGPEPDGEEGARAEAPAPEGPAGGAGEASAAASPGLGPDAALVARVGRRAQKLAERARQRRGSLESLMEGLRGKSRRLASTPSIWPVEGWVTSHFGWRTSPFTGQRQFHGGLDIASRFGTEVVAPARGRVVFVGRRGALGKTLVVDHGFGIRTTYGHAAEIHVAEGEEVERGQGIAVVGSTGRSTGPHLHYAVAVEGDAVDPSDYIFE